MVWAGNEWPTPCPTSCVHQWPSALNLHWLTFGPIVLSTGSPLPALAPRVRRKSELGPTIRSLLGNLYHSRCLVDFMRHVTGGMTRGSTEKVGLSRSDRKESSHMGPSRQTNTLQINNAAYARVFMERIFQNSECAQTVQLRIIRV